jgi:AAA domain
MISRSGGKLPASLPNTATRDRMADRSHHARLDRYSIDHPTSLLSGAHGDPRASVAHSGASLGEHLIIGAGLLRQALAATVACLRPKLLVLDPFVRLHCVDENAAAEVAPLLAYLRHIQRDLHTAVALVHHARKGAAHERGGQALRGSSEFHAWSDSSAFLRRIGGQLQLSIEHRAAPGRDWMPLALRDNPPVLEVVDQQPAPAGVQPSRRERIEKILAEAGKPLSQKQIRNAVRARASDVSQALAAFVAEGRVIKSARGYRLTTSPEP